MKSLLSPLKRIVFFSFTLFAVFAGEGSGCKCGNESKLSSSHSSPSLGSSGGRQSSSSTQSNKGSKMSHKKIGKVQANSQKSSPFTDEIQDTEAEKNELIKWIASEWDIYFKINQVNNPFPKNAEKELLISLIFTYTRIRMEYFIHKGTFDFIKKGSMSTSREKIYDFYEMLFNKVNEKFYENNEKSIIEDIKLEINKWYPEYNPITSSTISAIAKELADKIEKIVSLEISKKWIDVLWKTYSEFPKNIDKKFLIQAIIEFIAMDKIRNKLFEEIPHEFYEELLNKVNEKLYKNNRANLINDFRNEINSIHSEKDKIKKMPSKIDHLVKVLTDKIEKFVSEKINKNIEQYNENSLLIFESTSEKNISKNWISIAYEAYSKFPKNINKKILIKVILESIKQHKNKYNDHFYVELLNQVNKNLYQNHPIFFEDVIDVIKLHGGNPIKKNLWTIDELAKEIRNNIEKIVFEKVDQDNNSEDSNKNKINPIESEWTEKQEQINERIEKWIISERRIYLKLENSQDIKPFSQIFPQNVDIIYQKISLIISIIKSIKLSIKSYIKARECNFYTTKTEILDFHSMLFNQVNENLYKNDQISIFRNVELIINNTKYRKYGPIHHTPSTINALVEELIDKIEKFVFLKILEKWMSRLWGTCSDFPQNLDKEILIQAILEDMAKKMTVKNINIFKERFHEFYVKLFDQLNEKLYQNNRKNLINDVKNEINLILSEKNKIKEMPSKIDHLVKVLTDKIEKFISEKTNENLGQKNEDSFLLFESTSEEVKDISENWISIAYEAHSKFPKNINKKILISTILQTMKMYKNQKDENLYYFYIKLLNEVKKQLYKNNKDHQESIFQDFINVINELLIQNGKNPIQNIPENIEKLLKEIGNNIEKIDQDSNSNKSENSHEDSEVNYELENVEEQLTVNEEISLC